MWLDGNLLPDDVDDTGAAIRYAKQELLKQILVSLMLIGQQDPSSIRTTFVGSLSELFHDVRGDVYTTSEG